MRVFSTGIDMQASEKFTSKSVLRKHTTYSVLDKEFRMYGADKCRSVFTLSTRITRVSVDHALSPLLTSHSNFLSIDYDNIIATINIGRIACFVLALDNMSNLASHTA